MGTKTIISWLLLAYVILNRQTGMLEVKYCKRHYQIPAGGVWIGNAPAEFRNRTKPLRYFRMANGAIVAKTVAEKAVIDSPVADRKLQDGEWVSKVAVEGP